MVNYHDEERKESRFRLKTRYTNMRTNLENETQLTVSTPAANRVRGV